MNVRFYKIARKDLEVMDNNNNDKNVKGGVEFRLLGSVFLTGRKLDKIEALIALFQNYNGAKDRVKLALGSMGMGKMKEYAITFETDLAVVQMYADEIKRQYRLLKWETFEQRLPKSLNKRLEKLIKLYDQDFLSIEDDVKWLSDKAVEVKNVMSAVINRRPQCSKS